jgi:uncharacterized repeat protein (TIGR04076 family)
MEIEELWRRFQEHMQYSDEDMEIFRSDPEKVKMATGTPEFAKCRIIAEVIESHGCHSRHRVGDRFVMNASGQLLTDESPKRICVSAISQVGHLIPTIYERLVSKSDPNFERSNIVQCSDIGLDKGGWGKILMKVYVEKI